MVISVLECLPKEKKQKEEKILVHATEAVNISEFLSGAPKIERKFFCESPELPDVKIEIEFLVAISHRLPDEFLQKNHRILTLRLLHAASVPDSWLGSNFNASLPVPVRRPMFLIFQALILRGVSFFLSFFTDGQKMHTVCSILLHCGF